MERDPIFERKKRKAVVFIVPRFFPHIGGVEYVVALLAIKLKNANYDVTIIAGESSITKPMRLIANGIEIIKWPTITVKEAYHIPRKIFSLKKLLSRISTRKPVIYIHSVHALFTTVTLALLLSRRRRTLIIFSPHYLGKPKPVTRLLPFMLNKLLLSALVKYVNVIIFFSKYEMNAFISDFGYRKKVLLKILTPPLSVDVYRYKWNPPSDKIVITMSGRIDLTQKRYDILLKSIPLVLQYIKNNPSLNKKVEIKIIGEGPHVDKIKKLSRILNIDKYLSIKEHLPRHIYLKEISTSTMYVYISEYENYGIAPREAIMMGVPTIVSYNTALRELADSNEAFGIDFPVSPTRLAQKIVSVLRNIQHNGKFKERKHN